MTKNVFVLVVVRQYGGVRVIGVFETNALAVEYAKQVGLNSWEIHDHSYYFGDTTVTE